MLLTPGLLTGRWKTDGPESTKDLLMKINSRLRETFDSWQAKDGCYSMNPLDAYDRPQTLLSGVRANRPRLDAESK
ncbi:hypothetical protein GCM10027038_24230 [Arthrobacter bambusae]